MKNFKVWQKLALVALMFVLPLALVSWKMAAFVDEFRVAGARHAVEGLEYYAPLRTLLKDLQQHRGMANAWLSGNASFRDSLELKRADIETGLRVIDGMDRKHDALFHTRQQWRALHGHCRDLLDRVAGLSPDESFELHSQSIAATLALITDVGDASRLTSDPDLDSYSLANIVISQGPVLGEFLAQARGLGARVATDKRLSAVQSEKLTRLLDLADYLQRKLDRSMDNAFEANAALRPQLEENQQAAAAAVQEAAARVKALLAERGRGTEAGEYFSAMTRSVDAISQLEERILTVLQKLLKQRVALFRHEQLRTIGWALLGLVLACVIAVFIVRDITDPLAQVVRLADRIAAGDLTVQPAHASRKDEIGVLGRAFQHMAEELTRTVGEMQSCSLQVNTLMTQIAATSKDRQATASEVAATTTEIGATSREIFATSQELVRTMGEVAGVGEQTAALAGNGQESLSRMEETMRQVMEAAGIIAARLALLDEKAHGITQIVAAITKVTGQTNLLSLSAAIEAEKAGDHGHGFATVAVDIRRLADETATATRDIERMVVDIQSAVAAGVSGMDVFAGDVRRGLQEVQQVAAQLTEIIGQVRALTPRFDAVNEAMQAQANGAEQISDVLVQLSEVARQSVDSLQQSNQGIEVLKQVCRGLRAGISRFTLQTA